MNVLFFPEPRRLIRLVVQTICQWLKQVRADVGHARLGVMAMYRWLACLQSHQDVVVFSFVSSDQDGYLFSFYKIKEGKRGLCV